MERQTLWFTAPHQVELRAEPLPAPGAGAALVQTLCSAISPGTESLIYRGQFPQELAADDTIAALSQPLAYPLAYGYSAVGRVVAVGAVADEAWLGRLVFAFQPHTSHFVAPLAQLLPVPPGLVPEEAVFLPNMETAVNFLLDGAPLLGEHVIVFGQGVVGLLTTALLAQYPLAHLLTLDLFPQRRAQSVALGATVSLDPTDLAAVRAHLATWSDYAGADLVYELSGSPVALDQAIALAGFNARIVIGSWYGQKRAALDLGGRFHRARQRLLSSQVSTLTPELSGRWTKARRFAVAWHQLLHLRPARLITHRYPHAAAAEAYAQLDQRPAETLQVVLTYPDF